MILPAILSVPLAPHIPMVSDNPTRMDFSAQLSPPSEEYLLGTDELGRDLLSRILFGSRISLYVAITVSISSGLIGFIIGATSAYYGRLDILLMRLLDGWMAFPPLLLALLVAATLGTTLNNLILALSIVYIPRIARVVRGAVLEIKETDYVESARALGSSDLRIIARHIAPNVLAPFIVQVTITLAYSILAEASVSFVGVGVPPPTPSWGNILSDARTYFQRAPWLIMPGVMIVITVLGFNMVGDGLRDLLDPKTGKERG